MAQNYRWYNLTLFEVSKSESKIFLVPLLVVLISTVLFQDVDTPGIEIDALKGVLIGVAFTFFIFIQQTRFCSTTY